MTILDTFEADEAAALADLDSDLQAVAKTSPQRAAAISAAQVADLAGSDEGRQAREAARLDAITADQAARTGLKGRPPISDERRLYREIVEQHDEAPDIYKVTWVKYAGVIESLKTAGPALDELQAQADQQVKLATQTVEHLEQAAETFAKAVALADSGRATMARLSDLVACGSTPFAARAAGPRELADLAKRWRLRFDAESARLGVNQEAELQEQRDRRADAEYRKALDAAVKELRRTSDGKRLWMEYESVMKEIEAARGERPDADLSGIREQAQRLLSRFYETAAGHGGLEFRAETVPQV